MCIGQLAQIVCLGLPPIFQLMNEWRLLVITADERLHAQEKLFCFFIPSSSYKQL